MRRLGSDFACGAPGSNWVDPPKRERKRVVNYAENEYFRNAMKASGGRNTAGGPRLPKMPALQDFQFYDTARLLQLYDKEQAHEVHKHAVTQREAAARAQVMLPLGVLSRWQGMTCIESQGMGRWPKHSADVLCRGRGLKHGADLMCRFGRSA